MYEIIVEDSFAAAHRLTSYKGACESLHGHNYKVKVCIMGNTLDKANMLIDFKKVHRYLKETLKRLDHTFLNNIEYFSQNPSCEILSKYIYEKMKEKIKGKIKLKYVEVKETEKYGVRYSDDMSDM